MKNIWIFFECIEKLKDFELTLQINQSVPCVSQPSRKIPYNLRQKLLGKIAELEQNVTLLKKLKVWVTPFVIFQNSDGNICIIVDMKIANKAIKRKRHPIHTVKEIVHKMSGACHFSKLDLHSGYHQLELDAAL